VQIVDNNLSGQYQNKNSINKKDLLIHQNDALHVVLLKKLEWETIEAEDIVVMVQDKCSKLPVQTVERQILFLSNHEAISPYFAETVLDNSKVDNS